MISMELVNKIYFKVEWCKVTHFMILNFHLNYWNLEILKVSIPTKALSQEYAGKEKSLKSKFELVNADKIKQENALWNYNTNFILLPKN